MPICICAYCGGTGFIEDVDRCRVCKGSGKILTQNEVTTPAPEVKEEPPVKPRVVCLCGSTRFKEAFEKAERDIALRGEICLTVGLFGHIENLNMKGLDKKNLDELHLRKIDIADEVFIINVGGYIGESTARELAYAIKHGKQVSYLEPPDADKRDGGEEKK